MYGYMHKKGDVIKIIFLSKSWGGCEGGAFWGSVFL